MIDRDKIIKGLDISIQRLIAEKRKNNDELVIQDNNKIIKIKATEL